MRLTHSLFIVIQGYLPESAKDQCSDLHRLHRVYDVAGGCQGVHQWQPKDQAKADNASPS